MINFNGKKSKKFSYINTLKISFTKQHHKSIFGFRYFLVVKFEYKLYGPMDAVNLNKLHSPKDLQFRPHREIIFVRILLKKGEN